MTPRIPIADLARVLKTGIVKPAPARKKRADRGGFDSYAERDFACVLEERRLASDGGWHWRHHWLRVQLDGGTVWTPDFVTIPKADLDFALGIAHLTITRGFKPQGIWNAYEVQAAPWRTKGGKTARHASKEAQRVRMREVVAMFPWLRVITAEKIRGDGFREIML